MTIKTARWATLLALLLSLSTTALAAVSFTNEDWYIYQNQPFTITWTNNRGPVNVTLMSGPDDNLLPVLPIISGYPGQEYTWTPPPTLQAGTYTMEVVDGGSSDYSAPINYPSPPQTTSTTASGTSPPTSTPSSTTTTSPAPASPSPTNSTSSSALPTGAIAAIATLGGLLFIALLSLAICFFRRRQRNRARDQNSYELPLNPVDSPWGSPGTATTATAVGGFGGEGGGGWKGDGHRYQGGGWGYGGTQGRAELPVGWAENVELSAEGRHQR